MILQELNNKKQFCHIILCNYLSNSKILARQTRIKVAKSRKIYKKYLNNIKKLRLRRIRDLIHINKRLAINSKYK